MEFVTTYESSQIERYTGTIYESLCVRKTGKQKKKRTRGPLLVTGKVSEHIFSKVEPITRDLCSY